MYRELISRFIAENPSVKLQPPCSEKDLSDTERIVGFTFPDELKALLREINGDRWLIMSTAEIISTVELNRSILSECFDTYEEYLQKIDRHIFFAGNGCGDYFCYRILPNGEADTSAIFMWDHETFESHMVAKNISDLIIQYYSSKI